MAAQIVSIHYYFNEGAFYSEFYYTAWSRQYQQCPTTSTWRANESAGLICMKRFSAGQWREKTEGTSGNDVGTAPAFPLGKERVMQ